MKTNTHAAYLIINLDGKLQELQGESFKPDMRKNQDRRILDIKAHGEELKNSYDIVAYNLYDNGKVIHQGKL